MDAPIHVERLGDRGKISGEVRLVERETILRKTDPHEKCAIMHVCGMLVGLEDIPIMLKDKSRDSRYNSWLIWT